MDPMKKDILKSDPLSPLKKFTTARIALGRVGTSIPIKESLEFKLAHAHARDAVYSLLHRESLLQKLGVFKLPLLCLHSKAISREEYLKRPDHGRSLDNQSHEKLLDYSGQYDIAIMLVDGLSATAVNENSFSLLNFLIPLLQDSKFSMAPLSLVEQGRVAIGDEIGSGLGAKLSLILIGERPGLSASDSLGAYLTYNPKKGLTDESRNCVSNIRPLGMDSPIAAQKIYYLIKEAFRLQLSGVNLKDNAGLLNSEH
jgi:ethanolamine ammonia-lyase small subunit